MGVHVLWEAVQSEDQYFWTHRGVPHGNTRIHLRDMYQALQNPKRLESTQTSLPQSEHFWICLKPMTCIAGMICLQNKSFEDVVSCLFSLQVMISPGPARAHSCAIYVGTPVATTGRERSIITRPNTLKALAINVPAVKRYVRLKTPC